MIFTMKLFIVPVCLVLVFVSQVKSQAKVGGMHNNVVVCTADTSGMIRSGVHIRRKGDCQQGYVCNGGQITELRAPCPQSTYYSVHTGTCSFPNVYTYVFGSFNCSAEENDPNLSFDVLNEKRMRACQPLMARADDPDMTELYVGDPDDCRQMFKCPLVASHDEWLHKCPVGFRFQDDPIDFCTPDTDGCGQRVRG